MNKRNLITDEEYQSIKKRIQEILDIQKLEIIVKLIETLN